MFIDPVVLESSEISAGVKALIRCLHHDFTNRQGICDPGQAKIAQRMSCSIRSVQRYLKEAVELKLIAVRHRWLWTSVYKLLCLVPPKYIHKGDKVADKLNPSKNYKNVTSKNAFKIPKSEWKLCYQDAQEILGRETAKKNRGWLSILIRTAGVDLFLDSLRWLRSQMLMGEAEGKPIHAPGGLQLWYLRKQGVAI